MTIKENRKIERNIVQEYSNLLSQYALQNRHYYQDLYADGTIPLNSYTIKGLPAYSMPKISKLFSKQYKDHIKVDIVSEKPRNPNNKADTYEREAIDFFKKEKKKKMYIKEYKDFYQYAVPLKITKKCLLCHGDPKNAPQFIRKKYKNAYGYHLGDTRGILSIKIQKKKIDSYFNNILINTIIKNTILFLALLLFVLYISRKNSQFNDILKRGILEKTKKLKIKEEHIAFLYRHDPLTKLPNRFSLKEDIERDKVDKLAYPNIDDFKNINELFGIETGDRVLKEYALYLKQLSLPKKLKVYRLSSDEFALYSLEEKDDYSFLVTIKDIIASLNSKIFLPKTHNISLSTTAGISFERENILRKADIALKKAKQENIELKIYSKDDNIELNIKKNIEILRIVKTALHNDRVIPYFQPIKDMQNNTISKYESLVRIIDKDKKPLSPAIFLDIAKKSRLYGQITKKMIKKTFEMQKDNPDITFSINISYLDILNKDSVEYLKKSLKKLNDPSKIILELLESEKMKNYKDVKKFISEVKEIGCKFAIDDFGVGYSNFSHLVELDIDFIKIDASLIKNIATDKTSLAVVNSIVNFAKTIGAKTVAEYVESEEIYSIIKELKIDFAQGYYIGKPANNIIT